MTASIWATSFQSFGFARSAIDAGTLDETNTGRASGSISPYAPSPGPFRAAHESIPGRPPLEFLGVLVRNGLERVGVHRVLLFVAVFRSL